MRLFALVKQAHVLKYVAEKLFCVLWILKSCFWKARAPLKSTTHRRSVAVQIIIISAYSQMLMFLIAAFCVLKLCIQISPLYFIVYFQKANIRSWSVWIQNWYWFFTFSPDTYATMRKPSLISAGQLALERRKNMLLLNARVCSVVITEKWIKKHRIHFVFKENL